MALHQVLDEVLLKADARLGGAKVGRRVGHLAEGRVGAQDVGFQRGQVGGAVGQSGDVECGNAETGRADGTCGIAEPVEDTDALQPRCRRRYRFIPDVSMSMVWIVTAPPVRVNDDTTLLVAL